MLRIPLLTILFTALAGCTAMAQHNYSPAGGFVPDSASAVRIAAAVLRGAFREDSARLSEHLEASLRDGVWRVRASRGPTLLLELAQGNARVLGVKLSVPGGEPVDFDPPDGFISDAVTATTVAECILGSVYGSDRIAAQRPLLVSEANGVWTVKGQRPPGTLGGVALIELRRDSGEVVRVTHSR